MRNPDNAMLANEAVNALFPQWLAEVYGADMPAVYNAPAHAYTFLWHGHRWSYDQVSETLSAIVPAQLIGDGYTGAAQRRVCNNIPKMPTVTDTSSGITIYRPSMDPHTEGVDAYDLTRFLVRETRCDLRRMRPLIGEIIDKALVPVLPALAR